MSQTADSITPSSRMLSHFTSPLTVLPFPRRTEEYSEEQGGIIVRIRISVFCFLYKAVSFFRFFAAILFDLASAVLNQETGWRERLQNGVLYFVSNAKTLMFILFV